MLMKDAGNRRWFEVAPIYPSLELSFISRVDVETVFT